MKEEITNLQKAVDDIKNNHLHTVHLRLVQLETKQKVILGLLFVILGVLIAK